MCLRVHDLHQHQSSAVIINVDEKRLKNGKPFPDPFLLTAKELGFDAKKMIVFEDSLSSIRAGVACGATVVAVCKSCERSKSALHFGAVAGSDNCSFACAGFGFAATV